jgi:hypothetical protein
MNLILTILGFMILFAVQYLAMNGAEQARNLQDSDRYEFLRLVTLWLIPCCAVLVIVIKVIAEFCK